MLRETRFAPLAAALATLLMALGAAGCDPAPAADDLGQQRAALVPTSVVVTASPSSLTRSSTITATVRNSDGTLSKGTPVTLATTAGALSTTTATTDTNGQARATLTYSGTVDATARVTVTASGGASGYADVGLVGYRTITASGTAGGTISPSGAVSIIYGSSQYFAVSVSTGYHLVDVAVDGASQGPIPGYLFTNVTAEHTISATFAIDTFTIAASAGPHGSLSPSGTRAYNYGAEAFYTFSPAPGYQVEDVVVDGVSVDADGWYSFSNITASHAISVTFVIADQPPTLAVSPDAASWTEESPPVPVDPGLTLTDPDGTDVSGAKVLISGGYVASEDRLLFTPQGGVTGFFDPSTGVLSLNGTAPPAVYQAIFRSVAYANAAAGGTPDTRARQVTFSLGAAGLFDPATGHYYEVVPAVGIPWTDARDAAASGHYYGLQGYLATITGAAEQAFIAGTLRGQGWIGASDASAEWRWRWVTGPEGLEEGGLGRTFFMETSDASTGCAGGPRGSETGGQYQGWAGCEPDDAGDADFADLVQGGPWRDDPDSIGASVQGYVVEYGGMPDDAPVQVSGTRALQVHALPVYTISASAGPNGSISPSGGQSVKQGHSLAFQITPAAHHHVLDVAVNGASVGPQTSYTFQAVAADGSISASFAIDQVAVTSGATGPGTIRCDSPVDYGSPSACTLTPSAGYELSALLDGTSDVLSQVEGGRYVIASVTAPHDVRATFLKSRGIPCGAEGECHSGFCVDGVCCESACGGQCESCSGDSAGFCQPVTGAPQGGRPACATDGTLCGGACDGATADRCAYPGASTQCRQPSCSGGTATLAASCDGAGACPAPQVSPCGAYVCGATACNGDCETDQDCAGGHWCSGGVCRPKGGPGDACTAGSQCGSDFCVDGVCCNAACDGQCEACAEPGHEGQCQAVAGAPRGGRPACADDGSGCGGQCDGTSAGACAYPGASTSCRDPSCEDGTATLAAGCDGRGACPARQTQSCGDYVCGPQACLGTCQSDGDCVAGLWCSAGVCVPRKPDGISCGAANQCGSGSCVDGVCCNTACNGQCEACDVSGSVGQCTPATGRPHGARPACGSDGTACGGSCDGEDPAACAYPGEEVQCREASCSAGMATLAATCNGRGACPAPQAQQCGEYACAGTTCRGDCASDQDCAANFWCSAGQCVPRGPPGAPCGAASQCASGFCVDGVCCNAACDGQCEACDAAGQAGQCVAVSGAPRGTRPTCDSDGTACGGSCDGRHGAACSYPGEEVQCRQGRCSSSIATSAGLCDGHGHCPLPVTNTCERYVCGATACKTSCQGDEDCGPGLRCSDEGACRTGEEIQEDRLARLRSYHARGDGFGCAAGPGSAGALELALIAAAALLRRRRSR